MAPPVGAEAQDIAPDPPLCGMGLGDLDKSEKALRQLADEGLYLSLP
jgi:hypothetical protein